MKPIIVASALCLLPLLHVHAQSADDLIGQLKLHTGGPTRGIRPAAGPMPTAPVAEAPAAAPAAPVRPVVAHVPMREVPAAVPVAARTPAPQGQANLTVQFENGSDRLTPAAAHTLDTLGQALGSPDLAGDKFRIVGHTDAVGRPDSNKILSERRAEAVVNYLSARYKVDPARLMAVGVGQSEPLVPAADGVAMPQNRRVQVINLGS